MRKILNFIKQVYRGKSLRRIVVGWKLEEWCADFSGTVVDFGAGYTEVYKKFIKKEAEIISTDINKREGIVFVDLNKPLPFADASVDIATLFLAIYILEDQVKSLKEIHRILKPEGKLYIITPLISPEIPEPHDYCRFTYEGLESIFVKAGFSDFLIERSGGRASSATILLAPLFLFNTLRLFMFALSLLIDRLVKKRDVAHPCPHTYFCVLKK